MTVTSTRSSFSNEYDEFVDGLLLERLNNPTIGFGQLLVSLPGIYPSQVLRRLARLVSLSQIPEKSYERLLAESGQETNADQRFEPIEQNRVKLPVGHPLDFEWRFGETAAKVLLDTSISIIGSDKLIGLLGAPSILRYTIERGFSCPIVLIDKNPLLEQCFAQWPTANIFKCDIARDPLPELEASVVIVDPPWYREHMRAFLWAACELSGLNSHLLLSVPPDGTRPGIKREMEEIYWWMQHELGLTRLEVLKSILPYRSPLFERNALRAEGIPNVPAEWRCGDLWLLKTANQPRSQIPRPTIDDVVSGWTEELLGNIRVKLRNNKILPPLFTDPTLKTIVHNDILPSVSKRDPRRDTVDIWTSGNRVFASSGTQIVGIIIRALAAGNSANDEVSSYLDRDLSRMESSLVSATVGQLSDLNNLESDEIYRYGEDWTNVGLELGGHK